MKIRAVGAMQTDRQDEANIHFSQFCQRAYNQSSRPQTTKVRVFKCDLATLQTKHLLPYKISMKYSLN
jgi:predicted transglutaminase-like cysteine proteinase